MQDESETGHDSIEERPLIGVVLLFCAQDGHKSNGSARENVLRISACDWKGEIGTASEAKIDGILRVRRNLPGFYPEFTRFFPSLSGWGCGIIHGVESEKSGSGERSGPLF